MRVSAAPPEPFPNDVPLAAQNGLVGQSGSTCICNSNGHMLLPNAVTKPGPWHTRKCPLYAEETNE